MTISWEAFEKRLKKAEKECSVGDYVEYGERGLRGRVRYVGAIMDRSGEPMDDVYYGIEVEYIGDGDHDGRDNGFEYFSCERDTGVFVPQGQIQRKLNRKHLRGAKHLKNNARPIMTRDQFQEWFRKPTRGGRSSRDRSRDRDRSRGRDDRSGGRSNRNDDDRSSVRSGRDDRRGTRGGDEEKASSLRDRSRSRGGDDDRYGSRSPSRSGGGRRRRKVKDPLYDLVNRSENSSLKYAYSQLKDADKWGPLDNYFNAVADVKDGMSGAEEALTQAYRRLITAVLKMDRRTMEDHFQELSSRQINTLIDAFRDEEDRQTNRTNAAGRIGSTNSSNKKKELDALRRVITSGNPKFVTLDEFSRFLKDLDFDERPDRYEIRTGWNVIAGDNEPGRDGLRIADFRRVFNSKVDIMFVAKQLMAGKEPQLKSSNPRPSGNYGKSSRRGHSTSQPWMTRIYEDRGSGLKSWKDSRKQYRGFDHAHRQTMARQKRTDGYGDVVPETKYAKEIKFRKVRGGVSRGSYGQKSYNGDFGMAPPERLLIKNPRSDVLFTWLRGRNLGDLYSLMERSKSSIVKDYFRSIKDGRSVTDNRRSGRYNSEVHKGSQDYAFRVMAAKLLTMDDRREFNKWDLPGVSGARLARFWRELDKLKNLPTGDDLGGGGEYGAQNLYKKVISQLYDIIDDERNRIELHHDTITGFGAQQIVAEFRRPREDPDRIEPRDKTVLFLKGKKVSELKYAVKQVKIQLLKELFQENSDDSRRPAKKVDFDQFKRECKSYGSNQTNNELRKVFKSLEAKKDGAFTMADAKKYIMGRRWSEHETPSPSDWNYNLKKYIQAMDNDDYRTSKLKNMKNWTKMEVSDWIQDQDLSGKGKQVAREFRNANINGRTLLKLNKDVCYDLGLSWNSSTRALIAILDDLPMRKQGGKRKTETVTMSQRNPSNVHDVEVVVRAWYGEKDSHWDGRGGIDVTRDVEDLLRDNKIHLRCRDLDEKLSGPRDYRYDDKVLVIEYEKRAEEPSPRSRRGDRDRDGGRETSLGLDGGDRRSGRRSRSVRSRSVRDESPEKRGRSTRDRSPEGRRSRSGRDGRRSTRDRYDDEDPDRTDRRGGERSPRDRDDDGRGDRSNRSRRDRSRDRGERDDRDDRDRSRGRRDRDRSPAESRRGNLDDDLGRVSSTRGGGRRSSPTPAFDSERLGRDSDRDDDRRSSRRLRDEDPEPPRSSRNRRSVTRGETSLGDMSDDQIRYWLEDWGFEKYSRKFRGIDGRSLLRMEIRDIEDLGISYRAAGEIFDKIQQS